MAIIPCLKVTVFIISQFYKCRWHTFYAISTSLKDLMFLICYKAILYIHSNDDDDDDDALLLLLLMMILTLKPQYYLGYSLIILNNTFVSSLK